MIPQDTKTVLFGQQEDELIRREYLEWMNF